ncbi:MAG: phosphodiester glycosidase family protein [Muribaculaceae bacterium]|nr:phosphodiester glycosidase family protein [Muribaculaceae bacterium]
MKEKDFIDISDYQHVEDNRPVDIPVITVESMPYATAQPEQPKKSWLRWVWIAAAIIVVAICLNHFLSTQPPVSSSVSDSQNIESLSASIPKGKGAKGVEMISDSILGVAFNAYPLDGLRGSLEKEIPDTADLSVVLMMRSADYHPDGKTIGTMVIDGKTMPAKELRSRSAYLAFSKEGKPALGISRSNKLAEFAEENGGSFFRQFVLLGDGELPPSFMLHGKVERGAIGRMADGSLHYFLSRNRESMYDFADALREYGVVDAIYITGGNGYEFYRDEEGTGHVSDNLRDHYLKYPDRKAKAPMLVWRTK